MISECIAAYNQIDGKRFLLKNRDKPYNPEICVHHEMIDGTEVMYYTDVAANHAEGLNQHGIGIAYTTSNFRKDQADGFTKNIDIIKSALALIQISISVGFFTPQIFTFMSRDSG